jgi:hypothetical protein
MREPNTREFMSFLANINLHDERVSLKAVQNYGKMNVQLHAFLASVIDGGEMSVSYTGRFTLGERAYVRGVLLNV